MNMPIALTLFAALMAECCGSRTRSPLIGAVRSGDVAAVQSLLRGGADPNARGGGRLTPLMIAAGNGQEAIVRLLLRRGADPRLRDAQGEAAVDHALSGSTDIDSFTAGRCQAGTVKALLEAAPDTRPRARGVPKVLSLVQGNAGCAELQKVLTAQR